MSKYIKTIIGMVLIFCVAFSVVSCGIKSGTSIILENLYNQGQISEENLKNIAALRNGSLQKQKEYKEGTPVFETIEYSVIPVTDVLSGDTKSAILRDFKIESEEHLRQGGVKNYRITSSEIVRYYGTYNGWVVVEIKYVSVGLEESKEVYSPRIIGGYYLGNVPAGVAVVGWKED